MPKYTDKPNNKLPRATGMDDSIYNFSMKINKPYNPNEKEIDTRLRKRSWGYLFEKAYQNPNQTQRYYFEENGYEFENRATWFPDLKVIVSNIGICPAYSSHHFGTTCGVCGQHG